MLERPQSFFVTSQASLKRSFNVVMKKFSFTTILATLYLGTFCQSAQSLFIDSLKKQLHFLNDSAKVDGLNEVAKAFGTMGPNVAFDSINKYANAANKEALKMGYKKGEAFSLLYLTIGSTSADTYIKRAISIGESLKDPQILGQSYLISSYSLNNKSRIEALRKALIYFKQANDLEGQLEANVWLCGDYTSNGQYEEGFKNCDKCAQLIKQARLTPWGHEMALWYLLFMANLYERAGDNETSLEYCRRGNQYAQKHLVSWNLDLNMITRFTQLGQYDSAFYYWKKFESSANPYVVKNREYWNSELGEIYLKTKQYDKALAIAKEGIAFFKKQKSTGSGLTRHLLSAAKVYTEMKNYKTALQYAKEGAILAKKNNLLSSIIEGYQLLADIYHHLGNDTNAYHYLSQYHALKDSVQNKQFYWRLNNYKQTAEELKKESQLGFLIRDNKIKQEQLKQQTLFKNFLFALLFTLVLIGIFVFRNTRLKRKYDRLQRKQLEQQLNVQQLESAKQHAELQQKASELEMQALRSQMNPHFIFNCLSSINRFILKNEVDAASDYLTRFSRLIRMVLINSQQSLISLEDELEMLRLYLDMERLRFKNAFDYNIIFTNRIDVGSVYIPPLLLQPFCENAIWHGLMHKEEKGHLDVALSMEGESLYCSIADDGIGRKKAGEMKSKSVEKDKSLGLKITAERLALLNGNKGTSTFYKINDLLNEDGTVVGTRVDLKIKYRDSVEEYV
jgi:hypothetical protein